MLLQTFATWRKRRAIGRYLRRLGPFLRKNYGASDHYTPQQVQRGVQETGLPTFYMYAGLCIYCDRTSFGQSKGEMGVDRDYLSDRRDVADLFFNGDTEFSVADAMAAGTKLGSDRWVEIDGPGGPTEYGDFGGGDGGGE